MIYKNVLMLKYIAIAATILGICEANKTLGHTNNVLQCRKSCKTKVSYKNKNFHFMLYVLFKLVYEWNIISHIVSKAHTKQ